MSLQTDLYRITNLTNLHAGAGDSTYGIVDKQVQRDTTTKLPIIHASSLKGALRECFEEIAKTLPAIIETIFGSDSKRGKAKLQRGQFEFFEGRLVSLPVRSNQRPFYQATTPSVLKDLVESIGHFGSTIFSEVELTTLKSAFGTTISEGKLQIFEQKTGGLAIDEFYSEQIETCSNEALKTAVGKLVEKKLLDKPVVLFSETDWDALLDRLPVIARNNLENGISTNLFYEEVVPRQAHFAAFVLRPVAHDLLETELATVGHRVQVGANATVGYGQCQFERIFPITPNPE